MLKNKAEFSFAELYALFSTQNLINIAQDIKIKGINIDSRTIENGELFVPLKGENSDGHDFIIESIKKGAVASLCKRSYYDENKSKLEKLPLILVDDTLKSLGALAKEHRNNFEIPVVAIGGSNGKTTTKEMLSSILSLEGKVLKTYRNFNNQLGVPLMLLQMDKSYKFAVLEIATNEPGEITILADMIKPTHGLVTNISKEHLEKLIDIHGVEMEETFLFGYLRKQHGMAFINYNDERLKKYAGLIEKKYVFGSQKGLHLTSHIELNDDLTIKIDLATPENQRFKIELKNTYGMAQAYNALAAIAIAHSLNIKIENIQNALKDYKPDDSTEYGRMRIEYVGNNKIINDCYNANPASMKIALDTLASFKGEKIAVLGDMLELGNDSEEEHKNILKYAKEKADEVYTFGSEFEKVDSSVNRSKEEIVEALKNKNENVVLVKGSRSMRMEDILKLLN